MYQLSAAGEEQVQLTLTTGDYVGETWLLGAANTSSYVEMTTDSDICILNRADFTHLIQDQHDIALNLLAGQAATISRLRQQTQLLGLPSVAERLTAYLDQLMAEQGSTTVTLPLKLKDLATYLGTTPETLSRQLTKLTQAGRISRHRHQVRVLDAHDQR